MSARSYRPAWPVEDTVRYLWKEVEKGRFHTHHVEAFLETQSISPTTLVH